MVAEAVVADCSDAGLEEIARSCLRGLVNIAKHFLQRLGKKDAQ